MQGRQEFVPGQVCSARLAKVRPGTSQLWKPCRGQSRGSCEGPSQDEPSREGSSQDVPSGEGAPQNIPCSEDASRYGASLGGVLSNTLAARLADDIPPMHQRSIALWIIVDRCNSVSLHTMAHMSRPPMQAVLHAREGNRPPAQSVLRGARCNTQNLHFRLRATHLIWYAYNFGGPIHIKKHAQLTRQRVERKGHAPGALAEQPAGTPPPQRETDQIN